MLIAQITDLHVAEAGTSVREFVDTNANLAAAVATLNAMVPRPDLVLATGDLTDDGRALQYEVVPDPETWQLAVEFLRARPPMRK